MSILVKTLILISLITITKFVISTDHELEKHPEDIEIITENSPLPNDTSKYQLKIKDIKIYKYLFNNNVKCTEVKQKHKVENHLDPSRTSTQHLTIWKYDRSKHGGRYPLSFSYTKDDEFVVDYGDECDVYVMFAGKWNFYGTGNLNTGKITTDNKQININNAKKIILILTLTASIIFNTIIVIFIVRLSKMVKHIKLAVERSEQSKLLI